MKAPNISDGVTFGCSSPLPKLSPSVHAREMDKSAFYHYWCVDSGDYLAQKCNNFWWSKGGIEGKVTISMSTFNKIFSRFRPLARLLRLDKGSALFVGTEVVIMYMYGVYRLELAETVPEKVMTLDFRNPLFGGVLVSSKNEIYFGEYKANWQFLPIKIYKSSDMGKTWYTFYEFSDKEIFHVHAVHEDPYTNTLWVTTGDFQGQCQIIQMTHSGRELKRYGDGSQLYRAVGLLFYKDHVIWGMDTPLEKCHIVRCDRATGNVEVIRELEGTAWNTCKFTDGSAIIQATAEKGRFRENSSNLASIYFSENGENWIHLKSWEKDIYPNRYFGHGVVSFPEGSRKRAAFLMQGECLKEFDGISSVYSIGEIR